MDILGNQYYLLIRARATKSVIAELRPKWPVIFLFGEAQHGVASIERLVANSWFNLHCIIWDA